MGKKKKVRLNTNTVTMENGNTGWEIPEMPDMVVVEVPKCKKCESQDREILRTTTKLNKVFRRCRCLGCGQVRIEKSDVIKSKVDK